jgi:hypothetical protein
MSAQVRVSIGGGDSAEPNGRPGSSAGGLFFRAIPRADVLYPALFSLCLRDVLADDINEFRRGPAM